jgi:hypothetical protein
MMAAMRETTMDVNGFEKTRHVEDVGESGVRYLVGRRRP